MGPFTVSSCSFVRDAVPAGNLTTSAVKWPTAGISPDRCGVLAFLLAFTGPANAGTITYTLEETDDATGSTGWAAVEDAETTLDYDATVSQVHLLTIKNPRKRLRISAQRITGATDIAVATAKGVAIGAHGSKQPLAQSVTDGRGAELIHK